MDTTGFFHTEPIHAMPYTRDSCEGVCSGTTLVSLMFMNGDPDHELDSRAVVEFHHN